MGIFDQVRIKLALILLSSAGQEIGRESFLVSVNLSGVLHSSELR